ncbi:DUF6503 family protein [Hyunsoonleella aestuarii]|uniref:DUF6503 family protein n=1 Tax=Hyunsoonleella aestuarii TaxID=912802 RepID=UPI001FE97C08|nr:DUF6503 family protein [Hyunsoonleella aestuarii]
MRLSLYILFSLFFLWSCNLEKPVDVEFIVNKSIEVTGGEIIKSSDITFDFRNRTYKAIRDNGQFTYIRMTLKDGDSVFDILSNSGYDRFINDSLVKVADSMIPRYSASVNSVHYFSLLPYSLNDPAVNKTYIGKSTINNSEYYKVKVTFDQEGGGQDYEDIFVYWINSKSFKTDYLAYSYLESNDEIGLRFREAFNERYLEGIRFIDYNNYKPKKKGVFLKDLDKFLKNNELKLLSKIELENIVVKPLN